MMIRAGYHTVVQPAVTQPASAVRADIPARGNLLTSSRYQELPRPGADKVETAFFDLVDTGDTFHTAYYMRCEGVLTGDIATAKMKSMDIYELIRLRKSVRSYLAREVEQDKLNRVLDAARCAPSAGNRQEWRFVVVRDAEKRQKLAQASNHGFIAEAPVILACCAETDGHLMPCGLPSFSIDVAIAIDHLTLAAVAEGLGTCWIGGFNADKAKAALDIPEKIRIVELLPLGYPADPSEVKKTRKTLEEIVRYESW